VLLLLLLRPEVLRNSSSRGVAPVIQLSSRWCRCGYCRWVCCCCAVLWGGSFIASGGKRGANRRDGTTKISVRQGRFDFVADAAGGSLVVIFLCVFQKAAARMRRPSIRHVSICLFCCRPHNSGYEFDPLFVVADAVVAAHACFFWN